MEIMISSRLDSQKVSPYIPDFSLKTWIQKPSQQKLSCVKFYDKCQNFLLLQVNLQSVKSAKLLEQKSCPCHEKGLIKTITTTTYMKFKSFTLDRETRNRCEWCGVLLKCNFEPLLFVGQNISWLSLVFINALIEICVNLRPFWQQSRLVLIWTIQPSHFPRVHLSGLSS